MVRLFHLPVVYAVLTCSDAKVCAVFWDVLLRLPDGFQQECPIGGGQIILYTHCAYYCAIAEERAMSGQSDER